MNQLEQRLISFFLIISLLILPMTLTAMEREGANIEIFKTKPKLEGTPWETPDIKGELIAVKENSLLLLDTKGADVSVDVGDIREIKIVKKSRAKIGGAVGFITGAIVSIPVTKELAEEFDDDTPTTSEYIGLALAAGIIFSIPGGLIGLAMGRDITIKLEGKSEREIKMILEELRRKARVPSFQ